MKTALREIAQIHTGDFRLTPSQNLSIAGVTEEQKPVIDAILAKHGLTDENSARACASTRSPAWRCRPAASPSPKASACCPSSSKNSKPSSTKPACKDDAISLRVTGCPNGCARPYLAEIGSSARRRTNTRSTSARSTTARASTASFSPEHHASTTPSKLLTPVIKRYALERQTAKASATFCDRAILPKDATFHSVGTICPLHHEFKSGRQRQ
jgi:sulfite reductase (NADPH) hemoprotein beta-component